MGSQWHTVKIRHQPSFGETLFYSLLVSRHTIVINLCTEGMTNVRGRWGLGRSPQFLHGRHRLAFSDSILIIHFTGHHRNACLRGRSLVIERELVITPSDAVRPLCSVKLSPVISFGKAFFFFFESLSLEQRSIYFLSQISIQGKGRRRQKWFHRSRREMKGYPGTWGQVDTG